MPLQALTKAMTLVSEFQEVVAMGQAIQRTETKMMRTRMRKKELMMNRFVVLFVILTLGLGFTFCCLASVLLRSGILESL